MKPWHKLVLVVAGVILALLIASAYIPGEQLLFLFLIVIALGMLRVIKWAMGDYAGKRQRTRKNRILQGMEKGSDPNGANLSGISRRTINLAAAVRAASASSHAHSAVTPPAPRSAAWSSTESCCFVAFVGAVRCGPV